MPRHGYFITGTDTDVGKTFFGAMLVKRLFAEGVAVQPRKPIESGCQWQDQQLIPSDGLQYFYAVNQSIALARITPYRYAPPVAPPQAMQADNTVCLDQLMQACLEAVGKDDFLITEGAGGIYSPIGIDCLNADLAKALALPVILVVANRVGCINHTLLSCDALQQQQLKLAHIVINDVSNDHELLEYNTNTIKAQTKARQILIHGLQYGESLSHIQAFL